jgi:hypothetical protein
MYEYISAEKLMKSEHGPLRGLTKIVCLDQEQQ